MVRLFDVKFARHLSSTYSYIWGLTNLRVSAACETLKQEVVLFPSEMVSSNYTNVVVSLAPNDHTIFLIMVA